MSTRGSKQWAVMATKPGWSKPRFVWEGIERRLLVFDGRRDAVTKAFQINSTGGGMLYPPGHKPISGVTFEAFPVWTETMR